MLIVLFDLLQISSPESSQRSSGQSGQSRWQKARSRTSDHASDDDEAEFDEDGNLKSTPDDLVKFQEGQMDKFIRESLNEDAIVTEEQVLEAKEELERAKKGKEQNAEALLALQSDPAAQKIARRLLSSQKSEVDTAPQRLKFLNFEEPVAVDVSMLKQGTLPIDVSPEMSA